MSSHLTLQERIARLERLIKERNATQTEMEFTYSQPTMVDLHQAWLLYCPCVTYEVFKHFAFKLDGVNHCRRSSTIAVEDAKKIKSYILKTSRSISTHYFVNSAYPRTFLIRSNDD